MTADRRNTAFDRALSVAREAGADDIELSYAGTETQFARFASSRFTQVGSTWSEALRIRALVGNRMGAQVCASLDPARVAAAAAAAVEVARMTPALDVPIAFAGAGETDGGGSPGRAAIPEELTAARAPAALSLAFADASAGAGDVTFAGSLKVHRRYVAVRTHTGARRDFEDAVADAQMIGLAGDASGYAGSFGPAAEPIDFASLAATAADKARRSGDAITVEPGAYDVVLAPEAIAELLEWMSMASFGAASVLDETSLLTGRAGERLCDPAVTICDRRDPCEAAFDAEGTTRIEVKLIDAGVAGRPVTDRISAARLGDDRGSTGHATAVTDEESSGPMSTHLRLLPGDKTEAELIASVDRGLYVTRFHYVNGLLDTRRATTTGMTRDGTFLIENGAIGAGVRNLRFTEHILEALGRLGGIGRDVREVPTWWSDAGSMSVPAVLIRGFHFTGQSR